MNGHGLISGLWITFKHFINTYIEDFKKGRQYYYTEKGIKDRQSAQVNGIFSVQYPEEKLPVPENFRFLPFLVYRENEDGKKVPLCTACGICAKACPPQCISITRSTDPVSGKPISSPAAFYIDVDICMNCGFCAEYCPFGAIKMDHDYEISVDSRRENIYDLEKLMKPVSYYAKIRPTYYGAEEKARLEKEAAKNQANNQG